MMVDPVTLVAIVLAALTASTVAAVAGFGGAVFLLPVLVWAFGIRDAVPILTIVQLIGNLSRVYFNRRELVLPVVGWYAIGAIPMSVVGAQLFVAAPPAWLQRGLGLFLLLAVVYRHTDFGRRAKMGLRGFALVGGTFGFLSALLGTVGPLSAAFFLSYGLVKGAYIGTDALAAVVMHIPKLPVYSQNGLLGTSTLATGLSIGAVMIIGSFVGKKLLDRAPARLFNWFIEAVLTVSGVQFLVME